MELKTEKVILRVPDSKQQYAIPKAAVMVVSPTLERPLGSFECNQSPKGKSWRMVYDDKVITSLFESEGITRTVQNLFVAETKEECVEKAKALGMEIPVDPRDMPPAKVVDAKPIAAVVNAQKAATDASAARAAAVKAAAATSTTETP